MCIHLVLSMVAREAVILTEQLSGPRKNRWMRDGQLLSFLPLYPIEWAESHAEQSFVSVTTSVIVAQECLL